MNEDRFLHHEPCPKCGSRDNLGVWEDGHRYCFGCGYYQPASFSHRASTLVSRSSKGMVQSERPPVILPDDSDIYIPAICRSWLGSYGITDSEINNNRIVYSEKRNQLIFPYFDGYWNLLGYQARNFNPDAKAKWWSQGDLKKIYHILPFTKKHDIIVLVEDVVSAIKVSRYSSAMPLFGSEPSTERLTALYRLCNGVCLWLDPDMRKKSLLGLSRAQEIGLPMRVIYSDKDPKEHTDEEIKELLGHL